MAATSRNVISTRQSSEILRRCRALLASTFLLLTTALVPDAEANPRFGRASCSTSREGLMGTNMGKRNADRLVQQTWRAMGGSCDQLDRLVQTLSEVTLKRPFGRGGFGACFHKGYTEGVWDALERIYQRCEVACFNAGAEIGAISADGYCAASLAVGGLYDPGFIDQPPLPICGMSLALGCRSEYTYVATQEFPGCRMYTEGAFELTFDNSVRQDCYVPSDVPIVPSSSSNTFSFLY